MPRYEMVVGLEVHVELATRTKAFCACPNEYGAPPNALVCPVCMGLPGTLPVFNREALRLAAIAGLALGCHVHRHSRFDRKNYFYPDLPKAYQITQFYRPLCERGALAVRTEAGERTVGITRIHIEEDAGKLVHLDGRGTAIDLNRCGVPLVEIVTEPDIRAAEEASACLRKLRAILVAAGVSACRMNEGGLRCDVNLSIHKPGEPFGTRAEIKNLNSFQSVERAIRAEYARQAAAVEAGEEIRQETRRFDQKTGLTYPMRRKEDSADYRYFPDPDLPELVLTDAELDALRRALPPLPDELRERFTARYGLTPYAAEQLAAEPWLADAFARAAETAQSPAALANLLLGEVLALLAARGLERPPVSPQNLAKLSDLTAAGRVNSSTGKRILAAMFDQDRDPEAYAQAEGLFALRDEAALRDAAEKTLAQNPALVVSYLSGKTSVEKALMGKAMALTGGRADPEALARLLHEALAR